MPMTPKKLHELMTRLQYCVVEIMTEITEVDEIGVPSKRDVDDNGNMWLLTRAAVHGYDMLDAVEKYQEKVYPKQQNTRMKAIKEAVTGLFSADKKAKAGRHKSIKNAIQTTSDSTVSKEAEAVND